MGCFCGSDAFSVKETRSPGVHASQLFWGWDVKMKAMDVLEKAIRGERLSHAEIVSLYHLPGDVAAVAHELRLRRSNPELVTFLIDRNINYTNVCNVACNFCAFYRTKRQEDAYTLDYNHISQKIRELEAVGWTRILMQGGQPRFAPGVLHRFAEAHQDEPSHHSD